MDNCEVKKAYKIPFNKYNHETGKRIFFTLEEAQRYAPKIFDYWLLQKRVVEPTAIFLIFDKEDDSYYEIGITQVEKI